MLDYHLPDLLADFYHNAPCGYHSLDADGVFVQINDTALKWLGRAREEVVGKMSFTDLLTPASGKTTRLGRDSGGLSNLAPEGA